MKEDRSLAEAGVHWASGICLRSQKVSKVRRPEPYFSLVEVAHAYERTL